MPKPKVKRQAARKLMEGERMRVDFMAARNQRRTILRRLKEAVVEAAKAWNAGWYSRPGKQFADADALYYAVRELEAAEKGKKI